MKGKLLALGAVAVLAVGAAGTARAAPDYRATDLGTLGGFSQAWDVNSDGLVVGQSGDHAFAWTRSDGMVDLGTLGGPRSGADHVTEAGQVVGYAYADADHWHTFSWTRSGGMVDVGTLGAGNSSPWDVSDAGQVVGQSNWNGFPPAVKAFSWTGSGGIVDLGMLGLSVTIAYAVNDAGQVVGWSGKPFVWSAATGMQMVAGFSGVAADINDHGRIVGWANTPGGQHAVVWPETGGMIDLGRIGPVAPPAIAINDADEVVWLTKAEDGSTHVMFLAPAGQPIDIGTLGGTSATLGGQFPSEALNDAGQIVGRSTTAGGTSHAFVWSLADGMVDLGTLGGATSQAVAISENGLIAGSSNVADGTIHSALWEPRRDTTPPALTVHDVAVDATEPAGAIVDYTVTAADDTDPSPTLVCGPASGTLFAIGDTTVGCTATDASGNSASASFVVHVRGAEEQAAHLEEALQTLPHGLATSLAAKLKGPTVQRLAAFVHEVDAQTGKALSVEDAARLRRAAERIAVVLGG